MDRVFRIGMVIDPVGSYGRGVIAGVGAFAHESPHWEITIEPRWSFEEKLAVHDWTVDGMVVQVYSRAFADEVLRGRVPAVNVANWVADPGLPTVVPDDRAIAEAGAEYLRRRGFTRFAYFGPLDMEYSQLRCDGFAARVAEWELPCEVVDCSKLADWDGWVRGLVKPTAVFACNDDWAHKLLASCRRAGVRVPDDVAVLGVDDDELINSLVRPSLSSLPVPATTVGYEAARLLDRMIRARADGEAGDTTDRTPIRVPPTRGVVTRQSTDVLAVRDAEVAEAVRLIRQRAAGKDAGDLDVEAVLAEVAVSRRSLERRFKAALGHGVGSEIRKARMARAKQLLADTDLPIPDVAERAGFGGATRLGIVFRESERMTPTRYRQFARGLDKPGAGSRLAKP